MKKYTIMSLVSAGLLWSGVSQADFYAGAGIGGSFNEGSAYNGTYAAEYKNSTLWSFSGGYEAPLPLFDVRGEVEYLHTRPKVKSGGTKQFDGLFLNGYADIPLVPIVDPYVGLGLGFSRFDHDNSFAVQGMLGLEYELPFAPMTIGGEYRYLKINETTGKVNRESKYHSNTLMFKLRYLF